MCNGYQSIPQLDLSLAIHGTATEKYALAMQMDKLCKEIGFFTVVNHGIPLNVFNNIYANMQEFFSLSNSVKSRCRPSGSGARAIDDYTPIGYSGLLEENAYAYMGEYNKPNDYVEKFSVSKDILNKNPCLQFPSEHLWVAFMESARAYYLACERVIDILCFLFTLALDLPTNFFSTRISCSNDSMRLQRYPSYKKEFNNYQGMAEHRDGSLITLLTGTSSGLEVKTPEGVWIRPVLKTLDCFLVNIGDLMMRWSNNTYVSTPHRVLLTHEERYSIAFFKLANDDTIIEPFAKFCVDKEAQYDPIQYKRFSLEKMNALFNTQK